MPRVLKRPWLQAYEEYTSQTESPKDYNIWCGISAICSTLKRNVCIPSKYTNAFYKIYPNQYIILVGPPGVGKGQAIFPATELVKKAKSANFISDRVTAEKIIELLSKGNTTTYKTTTGAYAVNQDNSATIVSTELPIFLQTSEWMLPLLCEMWDRNEFNYATKTKASYTASDICVSLVAGCVPDYIRKLNRDAMSAITGGFTSRCIFVYADDKSQHIAFPNVNGQFGKLEQDLVTDLQDMGNLIGEFNFEPDAAKLWEVQYQDMKTDQFESEVLTGFKSRMKAHVFKTAMALAISEKNTLTITRFNLYNAIKLINRIRDKVDTTFRSLGESPLAAQQDRILKFIHAKACCSKKEIYSRNAQHMTYTTFEQIMYILQMAECIECKMVGNVEMWQPKIERKKP